MKIRKAASYLHLSNEVATQLSRTAYTQSRVATGERHGRFSGFESCAGGSEGEVHGSTRMCQEAWVDL